ncbi:Nif3-like dinuclear metal center hexameric protein [Chitinophaga japonensis]|uniref:Putative NIF3 family GTP cyclohydrolase 1 type 2 n=1 Tax=Chitinophaga japonensis TaxID=104662 RepID=A0A562T5I3_CHIJA|nr:Nif3-like dinuclear metal center hexameric protein [Chitinophaga japonensis]TWI88801.1 putative NIF3 family GTP cyclohydrolase 1 type 2 [Chitinophaga japonensis]
MHHFAEKASGRRNFLSLLLKTAGALLSVPGISLAVSNAHRYRDYTVQDIIDIVLEEIPGAPFKETVDTLKSGSAGQQVTGIVTTMFPTVSVIAETARRRANFIIAHEPTFYNHLDDPQWVANNQVVQQKQALLQRHGIAVWRFHDYWHTHRPDGIGYGVLKKAGWEQYYQPGERMLQMPPAALKDIVAHLQRSLGIAHVRVIGDPAQQCARIVLVPGAAGGKMQVSMVEQAHPDVLIVGEVHEWETAEYIRDARAMGAKTALVVLGHAVSEEPGMEWLVDWLQPKVPGLTVAHIPSGDPFTWH